MSDRIRVGRWEPMVRSMGPGKRFCLWVQGCSLRCPGCATPELLPTFGGTHMTFEQLWGHIHQSRLEHQIEGISLSGGEPFDQAPALAPLARRARANGLSVIAWSGYTREFLETEFAPTDSQELLSYLDVLIDGPFLERKPDPSLILRGSLNQTIHYLTERYTPAELERAILQVQLEPQGSAVAMGVTNSNVLRTLLQLFGL